MKDTTISVTGITNGCTSWLTFNIKVDSIPCNADFTYTIVDQKIYLQNNNTPNGAHIKWIFNEDIEVDSENADFNLSTIGNDIICLEVSYKNQLCTKCTTIWNTSKPLLATYDYTISGQEVNFIDKSQGNISKWFWDFGDGSISNEPNPVHSYNTSGQYNVCLTVFDEEFGIAKTKCGIIVVGSEECTIIANFRYTIKGDTVQFINTLSDSLASYWWDYGDLQTSTQMHPVHVYKQAGKYTITLSVQNSPQCFSQIKKEIIVGDVNCSANFDYLAEEKGTTMRFINQSRGNNLKYFWKFGNIGYSQSEDPIFNFKTSGAYSVSLVVYDTVTFCTDKMEKRVIVEQALCNAEFMYFVDSLTNIVYLKAQDQSINNRYRWIFADGQTANNSETKYRFNVAGNHKISLIVQNTENNCQARNTQNIIIGNTNNKYKPDFLYYPVTDNLLKFQFVDITEGSPDAYLWNFGDMSMSNEKSPQHTFSKSGIYNVCLTTIKNSFVNTSCQKVWVGDTSLQCVADFLYFADTLSLQVDFLNISTGNITHYLWNFGTGDISNQRDVSYTYTEKGYYPVLHVVGNANCRDANLQLINVGEISRYKAVFVFMVNDFSKKAGGYPVDFIRAGLGDEVRIRWSFGDGTMDSTTNSPTHVFENPGTYEVCYEISDPITGLSDKYCQMVSVGTLVPSLSDVNFTIYPNPFKEEFQIILQNIQEKTQVILTDITGKRLNVPYSIKVENDKQHLSIDGKTLKNGTYFITLRNSKFLHTQLIIKQ